MAKEIAISEVLDRLRTYVAASPQTAFFASPATPKALWTLEEETGLRLPPSYRQFLLVFDGGFVNISPRKRPKRGDEMAGARWNSHHLFGVADLKAQYIEHQQTHGGPYTWEGAWPYLPFCRTNFQELLVFSAPNASEERYVLSADHELAPHEWCVLQPNFAAFLDEYVRCDGDLNVVAPVSTANRPPYNPPLHRAAAAERLP